VRDANGQALAYVYFEDEPGRKMAAKLLARDEAQRSKKQQTTRQEVEQSLLGLDSRNGPSQILRDSAQKKKGLSQNGLSWEGKAPPGTVKGS
jgi:hypothetical protein